ncbi:MAG: VCBS repeat-containing protein, partial [Bacteroidetes bacterium]|nr:VCBS repeat-containing protein [Bacteroidota bacterium]
QYNYVKWITAASTGNYLFPFGIGGNSADYIPFTFNKTAGTSNIMMSTWATDTQNLPKPAATNVGAVTNMFGTADSVLYAVDRFWDIQTSAATTADLTFSYLGSENTTSSPTNLIMAQHWNGTSWDTQVGPGTIGVTAGVGTAGPFVGQNTFSPWVLTILCDASITAVGPYCVNSPAVNLIAAQTGGIWSGTGITDANLGTFNPSIAGAGNHVITYTLGCGDVDTTTITIYPLASSTDVQTACNSYTWIDGNNYTASTNTPTFTIAGGSSQGCDSIITLNLTINNSTTGTDVQMACNSYTWIDGNNYTASTNTPTYTIVGGSTNGCDSIVTLNLTINTFASGTDVVTSCIPITWIDGNNYSVSTTTPTFTIVGGSSQGCDSVVTLNLTINNSTTGTDVQTACNSYTWIDGNNYTASTNTPTFTIVGGAANGCDSVVTLNLTINTFASGTDVITSCTPITWIDGNNYSVSTTTPTFTIVGGSVQGCDSIVALNLTINPSANATINPDGPFCTTTAPLNLTAADAGGIWSGTGITNTTNGTFDPNVAGAGTHQIIYTISGACGDADTVDIVVNVCLLPPTGCCNFVQNANDNGVTSETFGVKLGDLDGDGDLDVVTIDAYDAIEVWLNNGSGIFAAGTTYSIGSDFYGVELEDIDSDGDLDVIAISFYAAQATEIWKNNGAGIFSLYQSINNNIGSENSRLADLDGDGDLDIFHTNWMGNEQKIYLNNGSGNFSYSSSVNTTGAKSDVALADFDGDGDIDALLSDKNGSYNELWLNNGSGSFTFSSGGFATSSNHSGTAAADFDGDGDNDFVVIGGASNASAELYLNNGNATFGSAIILAHLGSNYDKDVVTVDYDNDGDIDIIISTYGSNGVEVWNNDGAANFSLCYKNPSSVYAHGFDAGDVDGDGLVDIYLGNFSSSNGDRVFIQAPVATANPSITQPTTFCSSDAAVNLTATPAGGVWGGIGITDTTNGTFDPSIAGVGSHQITYTTTGTCGATDTVNIIVNNCNLLTASFITTTNTICAGDSITFTDNSVGAGITSWNWTFNGGTPATSSTQGPHTVTFNMVGTYNIVLQVGDGASTDDTTIAIIVNNCIVPAPCCNYTLDTQQPGTLFTLDAELGDLDGDGDLDVVSVSDNSQDIEVMFNTTGIYGAATLYNTATNPTNRRRSVKLYDYDGDGDLDMITAAMTAIMSCEVWNNNGAGIFTIGQNLITTQGFEDVEMGDFNGDGFVDILFVGTTSQVWLGNGVTFTQSQILTTLSAVDADLGDVDGDGDLDIFFAIQAFSSNGNLVWLNNGAGNFTNTGQSLGVGYSAHCVLGDLDGDSDLDAIATNWESAGSPTLVPHEIWINNGVGIYTTGGFISHPGFGYDVELHDYDGDGDLDIFIADGVLSTWNNDGNANFTMCAEVGGFYSQTYSLDLGDINGDGFFDAYIGINQSSAGDRVVFNNNCNLFIASFTPSATTICAGDSITFTDNSTGAGITSWNWTFNGGTPATANSQGSHTIGFNTAGTYNINLQISDGINTDDTTIMVTVNPTSVGADVQIACDSLTWIDGITYTTSTNTPTFTLTNAAGCDSVVTLNLTINNSTTSTDVQTVCDSLTWIDGTTYTASTNTPTFTLTNGAGCDSVVTLNLTINNSTTNTDVQTACDSLTWIDGITYTASTNTPTFALTNAAGCDSVVTLNLTINTCTPPTSNFAVSDTLICENECIDYTSLSTGANSWSWEFIGGTPNSSTTQNPTICYAVAGIYPVELIVNNTYGSDTLIKTIVVVPIPTITTGADITINLGEITTLTATGSGGSYTWSPPDWLSCINCQTTIASPEETTTYTVTADSNGCTASDNVTVKVDFVNIVFVPNIFSPNGDGANDIVYVEGKTIDKLHFFIYDRWGENVFETTDITKGWDGTFRGKEMNKAVFVYYLEATFKDGSKTTKKGDITLIK